VIYYYDRCQPDRGFVTVTQIGQLGAAAAAAGRSWPASQVAAAGRPIVTVTSPWHRCTDHDEVQCCGRRRAEAGRARAAAARDWQWAVTVRPVTVEKSCQI
jgi:hypothetical protein